MSSLLPCPSCARHVRRSETGCPFCGARLSLGALPERAMPAQRLGRAALLAFGTTVATVAAGCGQANVPIGDAGNDGGAVPIYGAPDVGPAADAGSDAGLLAMYGGPPPSDAGDDAGGNIGPAYGAPVVDGGFNDVDMGTSNADYGGPPHV